MKALTAVIDTNVVVSGLLTSVGGVGAYAAITGPGLKHLFCDRL